MTNQDVYIKAIRVGLSRPYDVFNMEYVGPPVIRMSDEKTGKIRFKISIHETGEPYIELIDSGMNR